MGDNFIQKVMSRIHQTRQNTSESNEELKHIIGNLVVQNHLSQKRLTMMEEGKMSEEFIQDLVQIVLAQLDHKLSERSELEAEKARLKAKQENEYKTLLKAIGSLGTGGCTGSSESQYSDDSNPAKLYSDSSVFPGISRKAKMNNLTSCSNEQTRQKDMIFNRVSNNIPVFDGFLDEQNLNTKLDYHGSQFGYCSGTQYVGQAVKCGSIPSGSSFRRSISHPSNQPQPLMNRIQHAKPVPYHVNFQQANSGLQHPPLLRTCPNSQQGRSNCPKSHLRKNPLQQPNQNNSYQKKENVSTSKPTEYQNGRKPCTRTTNPANCTSVANNQNKPALKKFENKQTSSNQPAGRTGVASKKNTPAFKKCQNTQTSSNKPAGCASEANNQNKPALKKFQNKQTSSNKPAGVSAVNKSNAPRPNKQQNSKRNTTTTTTTTTTVQIKVKNITKK